MIEVTYYYSACVGITTPDVRLLCDPWFTDGIYEGSWFLYPRLAAPLATVGAHDAIYISHLHPDHMDLDFLRAYLAAFPDTRVLIADYKKNYLSNILRGNGIDHSVVRDLSIGDTDIRILPQDPGDETGGDIDSIMAVLHGGHSVLNLNDNVSITHFQEQGIKDFAKEPTIALIPAGGASCFPHMYLPVSEQLADIARAREQVYKDTFYVIREAMEPRISIPFAGKHLLGGANAHLNDYRGMPDPLDYYSADDGILVLDDAGRGKIDTASLQPSALRTAAYDKKDMASFLQSISNKPFHFEADDEVGLTDDQWKALFMRAYGRALRRYFKDWDYYILFDFDGKWLCLNLCRSDFFCDWVDDPDGYVPHGRLSVDRKLLHGLLTGKYHWNNAWVGSLFSVRTTPFHGIFHDQEFFVHLHV